MLYISKKRTEPNLEPVEEEKPKPTPEPGHVNEVEAGIPEPEPEPVEPTPETSSKKPFSLLCPKCGATDEWNFRQGSKKLEITCDICGSKLKGGKHYSGNPDSIRRTLQAIQQAVTTPTPAEYKPCFCCGATDFWESKAGVVICKVCHPPPDKSIVRRWLN